MTSQLVNGTTQMQTMPIATQSTDQQQQQTPQQQENTNSQMLVTSPDRNQQTDSTIMLPVMNASIPGDDASKSTPRKNDVAPATEETPTVMDTSGTVLLLNLCTCYSSYNFSFKT